jgi:hypothetical protein
MDLNSGLLSLLSGVREEVADGKYHYYIGAFSARAEAERMLPELVNLGFASATIVEAR